jgi:hypothetical protein
VFPLLLPVLFIPFLFDRSNELLIETLGDVSVKGIEQQSTEGTIATGGSQDLAFQRSHVSLVQSFLLHPVCKV